MVGFKLRVISPEKVLLEAEVASAIFPGEDGFFGILPRHAPMVSLTASNLLTAKLSDGGDVDLLIHDGFAEIRDNVLTVLTRSAEKASDVDLERARSAAERARKRIRANKAEYDYARAVSSLRRALTREKYGNRS